MAEAEATFLLQEDISLSRTMESNTNLARFIVVTAIAIHAASSTTSKFLKGRVTQVHRSVDLPFEMGC
jgi:hypothetical protein